LCSGFLHLLEFQLEINFLFSGEQLYFEVADEMLFAEVFQQ
jgi:hypothetical protein